LEILRAERALDPQRLDDKLHQLHLEVMTTLAEMLARDCRTGHCEVCHSSCVNRHSLTSAEVRSSCAEPPCISKVGLPGKVTLAWVTQLPV
jgi:hypothetical protein